jgi:hypothetical protein
MKRGWAALAATGFAATMLAACTTTNTGHADSPPARATAPGRPVAAKPLAASRLDARPCTAAMLRIRAGREGDGPGAHGDIEFTDVARARCVLRGVPKVGIATSAGKSLPVALTRATQISEQQVVLVPGRADAADLVVFWSNWCGRPPGPLTVRVTLPADGGTVVGAFDGPPDYDFVPPCLEAHQRSTVSVIGAYETGTVG